MTTFLLVVAVASAALALAFAWALKIKRIYSCMNGHVPRVETSPVTDKVLLVCPRDGCGVATHLHNTVSDAIKEWNNAGSSCWRNYEVKWWHWFLRWWHGCFYE